MNKQLFLHKPGKNSSELDQIVRVLAYYKEHKTAKVISVENNDIFTCLTKQLKLIDDQPFCALGK